MEIVELPEMHEHDINTYEWSVKGSKIGEQHKVISNVCFYGHKNYEEYLSGKYQTITDNEQRWESYMADDAEVIVVAFGISSRIAKEAVKTARARGIRLGLIRPITLWPYPRKAFETLSPDFKGFVCVEMNILGQMVDDLKLATDSRYPIDSYGTFFDVPDTEVIIKRASELLGK